jgi:hypothetical protein
MTNVQQGSNATLTAEWRQYAGGPAAAVTGVTITITPVAGGAAVIGPTATGVTTPATGFNAYVWAVPGGQAVGDYLVTWTATDVASEVVTANEVITVTTAGTAGLGGPYATRAMLKARMGIPDSNTSRDTELDRRLLSASTDINAWTHRQFGRAEVATTRRFRAGRSGVDTHDFWTDEDLAITPYSGGVAGTAWDVSSIELEPMDGIVNETPGWPYRRISYPFGDHPLIRAMSWSGYSIYVTAKWGWAAIPENVVTSCLMLAVADDKAKDAPFGVAGFGDYAVRIRQNPMVEEKLRDYVIDPVKVAT